MNKSDVIALIQLILILVQTFFTSRRIDNTKIVVGFNRQGKPEVSAPWWRITLEKKFIIEMLLGTALLGLTAYYIFIFGRYSIFQLLILLFTFMSLRVTWKELKQYDRIKAQIESDIEKQQRNKD